MKNFVPSWDINAVRFNPVAVEVPMPEAFPVRVSGTPDASATTVPRFKKSRRELLIFILLKSACSGLAVEMVVQSMSSSQNLQSKKHTEKILENILKQSCKTFPFDL